MTVIALAALLLNDLVLKFVWQGSWITGKLSDLAWVIFASPLLAFILSFIARENRIAQRSAWIAAYLGLPLLYFAFNTFEPIHNFIISGFSLISGKAGGSPFDPTDSLVIPLGLAIALSVWRSRRAKSTLSQLRIGLIVAVLASLATLATSEALPEKGIISIGSDQHGNLFASTYFTGYENDRTPQPQYISKDGGLTWSSSGLGETTISWGKQSVDTPRGIYAIEGTDITRVSNGYKRTVYSAIVININADRIAQRSATQHLGSRDVTLHPHTIRYDHQSGNLVVGAGLQGVIIGYPGEKWVRASVDEFRPIDFSIIGRIKRMNDYQIWLMALALSSSCAALPLMLLKALKMMSVKKVILTVIAILILGPLSLYSGIIVPFSGILLVVIFLSMPIFGILAILPKRLNNSDRIFGGLIIVLTSILASAVTVWSFSGWSESIASTILLIPGSIIAILGAGVSTVAARPSINQLWAIVVSLSVMALLFELIVFMWMSGSFILGTAKIAAVLLNISTTIALGAYLWHTQENETSHLVK